MKTNKLLIVLFLIFVVSTVPSVSATDINDTAQELTVSDDVTVDMTSEIDNSSIAGENSDEVLRMSDDEVLSDFEINFGADGVIYLDDYVDNEIYIEFPDNAKEDSAYYFYIDEKLYKKDTIQFEGYYDMFTLKDVDCGNHSYKIVYKDTKNTQVTKTGQFKVDWQNFELDHYYGKDDAYDIQTIYYGDKYKNSITLPDDARGNLRVIVNNKTEYYFGISEFNNIVIPLLPIGRNEIIFEYSDSKYNNPKKAKDIVDVIAAVKGPDTLSFMEAAVFTLKLPKDANGTMVVHYPNHRAHVKLVDGYARFKLPILSAGNHYIYAWYNGTDYPVKPFGTVRYVADLPIFEDLMFGAKVSLPSEMTVGEDKYLRFKLPEDADGILEIDYEGVTLINGSAAIPLSELSPGEYTINVRYSEDSKYADLDKDFKLNVNKKVPSFNITLPKEIIADLYGKFTFTCPDDCYGSITIFSDDESFSGDVDNGKSVLKINIPKKSGNQSLIFIFKPLNDDYSTFRGLINFTSIPTPIIKAKDYAVTYHDGKTYVYKVRILDGYGKHVGAGEIVKVYNRYNKLVKTLKTDKNGYISLKYTKPTTKYYTFVYKGVESNDVFIFVYSPTWLYINGHHYDQKVKKNAKQIKVEVHLREPYNYVKTFAKKKVTVKFNGKTYKCTTNKLGIAKLTIKKNDIKKLKVGKKYKMTARYAKDTNSDEGSLYVKIIK